MSMLAVDSEFGMPSMPDMRTIAYWMDGADKAEWHSQSTLIAQHTRAGSFERRFAIALNENFRITSDLETYVLQLIDRFLFQAN